MLAVQAQDLRSARLAIRARSRVISSAEIDRALTEERTLVIGWLNRGTLHLVRREDYWWLHALTTPPLFTANARRLAQTGVTPAAAERGLGVMERALSDEGHLTRHELRDRLQAVGVETGGQALVHLLMLGCLRGLMVRGPLLGKKHAYVLAREWLGAPPPVERGVALGELARRYLRGHAPADDRDLARWSGLPLRDARAGLTAIASRLVDRADGLVELAQTVPAEPHSRLLDQWDPLLVGWRSREELLRHYPQRDSAELHFRPFAYVGGYAVAVWHRRGGRVELDEPFGPVTPADIEALDRDATDVERFLSA